MNRKLMTSLMGLGLVGAWCGVAGADVIYQDSFSGAAGTALGTNVPTVASGLDGGTAGAAWQANTATASDPDAIWKYSGSNSVSIVSPNGTGARDTNLIANAFLPFVPQAGFIYDLEATLTVPSGGSDNGHWVGLAFANFENGGTGGGSSALSNCGPTGLVIVRDAVNGASMNIFEGAGGGTGGSTNFSIPGGIGAAVTLDIILDTTGGLSAQTMSWEIDGTLVGGPVALASNPAINYVTFGDDTAPSGTVSGFSLTAVPEPGALALVPAAGLMLGRRRR
jgi:hypothetical protein